MAYSDRTYAGPGPIEFTLGPAYNEQFDAQQECIPVGYVPPEAVAVSGGGLHQASPSQEQTPPTARHAGIPPAMHAGIAPPLLQGMLGYHLQCMLGYPHPHPTPWTESQTDVKI